MQDVQDEPLFCDRVAGLDIAKAAVEVTVRVPSDTTAGRRQQEARTFGAARAELESLGDWLACWGVTKIGIFVHTQRVPKDCVAIGRRRIVVLDFRYGALGFVAIPGRVL